MWGRSREVRWAWPPPWAWLGLGFGLGISLTLPLPLPLTPNQALPPPELNELIRQILHGYKASIPPEQWQQFMASLHEGVTARLVERYQL